mmetsp:Transcript_25295/g.35332  ORF Transcript_25295/g.35332 Transcript_25295/m.35332 type:complete len:91 (+) Transcript_25295:155-427(+)
MPIPHSQQIHKRVISAYVRMHRDSCTDEKTDRWAGMLIRTIDCNQASHLRALIVSDFTSSKVANWRAPPIKALINFGVIPANKVSIPSSE